MNRHSVTLGTAAAILCVGIGLCGCSGQGGPPPLRDAVRSALAPLDYPRGSRIFYLKNELPQDSTVEAVEPCPGDTSAPAFVVPEPGHLIFIDEQPDYDWEHRAKIIFFPTKTPKQARVLFTNTPASCLKMRGASGEEIKPIWEKW